jgi:hypothetical protein
VSRLDSFIRRMQGQRDCLNRAATLIAGLSGPVLELGLGNGRTYDHLREILPDREIFVFDRRVAAHPASVPDGAHMILGDIRETLATVGDRIGAKAALVHVDVGTGDAAANAALAAALGPHIDRLAAPGAIVASDQAIPIESWQALPLPEGVKPGRYHLYRVGG